MYFLVVDHRLLELHKSSFLSSGRWVLSAAIPLGWAIGLMRVISPPIVTFLLFCGRQHGVDGHSGGVFGDRLKLFSGFSSLHMPLFGARFMI